MTVKYDNDSPYGITGAYSFYLDVLEPRLIQPELNDVLHTLTAVHEFRPDLLAFDLYQNSKLWWVFQSRNPNAIEDPIFDFKTGLKFYLPSKQAIDNTLGQ